MTIFTVSQINGYVKDIFAEDGILSDVYISGEISNLKRHSSGHMYFSLKDSGGAISAAMFKWQCQYLRFVPSDGMRVVAHGKITLYEQTGQYQIVVSSLQPDGIGALYAAYEQLKKKLEDEGLFSQDRKKPLPQIPASVGVITSKTGAAVRDIINVLGRRFPLAEVVLCPVAVQGADAPRQIKNAVQQLDASEKCDVIIVGRGGGSIEDLWAFNDEGVVRAVAEARTPIISAVGHETDFTLCDFAADMRAPTPSAAAELAVPDASSILKAISAEKRSMLMHLQRRFSVCLAEYSAISARRCFSEPTRLLELKAQRLDNAMTRITYSMESVFLKKKEQLSKTAARLAALNPMEVLARGYCAVEKDGKILSSAKQLDKGERVLLHFRDGQRSAAIE